MPPCNLVSGFGVTVGRSTGIGMLGLPEFNSSMPPNTLVFNALDKFNKPPATRVALPTALKDN
jgi:hypothetical protein